MKYLFSLLFVAIMLLFGYIFTFNELNDFYILFYLLILLFICKVIPLKKEKPLQFIDYLLCLMMIVIYEITYKHTFRIITISYLYLISFIGLEMYLNSLRFKHLLHENKRNN